MELAPFQSRTVEVASEVLKANGPRRFLVADEVGPEVLRERDPRKVIPPLHGALLKNEQDVSLFEKLAFMARREGR